LRYGALLIAEETRGLLGICRRLRKEDIHRHGSRACKHGGFLPVHQIFPARYDIIWKSSYD
jgi:hypothetical protein